MGPSPPRSLLTTQPKAGRRTGPIWPEAAAGMPVSSSVGSWLPCVFSPRRMVNWLAIFACCGISSHTSHAGHVGADRLKLAAIFGGSVRFEIVHVDVAGAARQVDHDDGLAGRLGTDGAHRLEAQQVGEGEAAEAERPDAQEVAAGDAVAGPAGDAGSEYGQHERSPLCQILPGPGYSSSAIGSRSSRTYCGRPAWSGKVWAVSIPSTAYSVASRFCTVKPLPFGFSP